MTVKKAEFAPNGFARERRRAAASTLKLAFLLFLSVAVAMPAPRAQTAQHSEPPTELATAERGVNLLMNADIKGATQAFRQIQASDPSSPLGYMLEADAVWWKIYLTTGDLVDPDVFDVDSANSTPYDATFERLVRAAISKSEANLRAGRDPARNQLYEGLAFALRARLLGLRGKAMPTARAGKKMRSLLMAASARDPSLVDADLGLGIYNYFVDTLPGIVKLLRWMVGLPPGNRELGLQQLQDAAEHGPLTSGEALFYLGKDYSRSNEQQYGKSLQYFSELAHRYPDNGLWNLLNGSVEIRLGHRQQGEQLYKTVYDETRSPESLSARTLHQAARLAIERMQPGANLGD